MYEKYLLDNGVRVVTEKLEHVRSVSIGFFMDVGSRDETLEEGGLAHVIEHMFFKGTKQFDVFQIANEINFLGGNVNAYTSQDVVCLHGKIVDTHLKRGVGLLADLLVNSTFDSTELDRERNVILEEIRMYDDAPDEQVIDNFTEALWEGSALGRPILGTPDNVARFTQADLNAFANKHFAPERLLVAVAGSFAPSELRAYLNENLGQYGFSSNVRCYDSPEAKYKRSTLTRNLEQTHFCLGTEGIERKSEDRFSYGLMNFILGGGMSSRIFQEVREKRGLAYSIGSHYRNYDDTGYFAISGGTQPGTADEVVDIILHEVQQICREAVAEDELTSSREAIKGSILLGLESTYSRMSRLADMEQIFQRYIPVEEVLGKLDAVTVADVQDAAVKYLRDRPVALSTIGPNGLRIDKVGELRF